MSARNSRRIARLAAMAMAASAALAQIPAGNMQRPQAPDGPPATVSGAVNNSVTSAPIARAHVVLRIYASGGGMQSYGAVTDGDGKFTIAQLPSGNYTITLEKAGFVMPDRIGSASTNLRVRPGDKQEDLKLKLTPAGSISGRVLGPDGEPVEGCSVMAQMTGMNGSGGPSLSTDEKGHYRIGALRPGKYTVQASSNDVPFPAEIRTDGTRDVHLARTYFPSAVDLKEAQRIDVAPGAEVTGIDIHLIGMPVVSVSGKVTGIPAGAQASVQVMRPQQGGSMNQTRVKSDGTFQIWRLDPGRLNLVAVVQQSGMARPQSAPFGIDVGSSDIEHVELRIIEPFDITGQIAYDDADARYKPNPKLPAPRGVPARRITLTVDSDSNAGYGISDRGQHEISEDDTFTVEKMTPGRYHVAVSWGAYVKSVRIGSKETEGDLLDLGDGPAGPITVTLSSVTAQISGTVTDANGPAPRVRVALLPVKGAPGVYITGLADANGNYKIANVTPGKYKIVAADDDTIFAMPRISEDEKSEVLEIHAGENLAKNLTKQ